MFVAGLWFAVFDWWRRKDRPIPVRRKSPPAQLPLLQQAIGFVVGSAIQFAIGGICEWILHHLIPWSVQQVLIASSLFPFSVGAVIGLWLFYGDRMFQD